MNVLNSIPGLTPELGIKLIKSNLPQAEKTICQILNSVILNSENELPVLVIFPVPQFKDRVLLGVQIIDKNFNAVKTIKITTVDDWISNFKTIKNNLIKDGLIRDINFELNK